MGLKDLAKGKKKVVFILAGLFILFIIISAISIVYTERPQFCITCHIMKPYYASWEKSAHKEVNCIECHYEPGLEAHIAGKMKGLVQVAQYITKKYSKKPAAEVSDASCLRQGCHKKEELKSKKVLFKNNIGFEHNKHFGKLRRDIQLRCTSCHSQLTFDEHMAIDENTCFICHFKNVSDSQLGRQCLGCHAELKKSPEHKEYIGSGSSCSECHSDIKTGEGNVRQQMCYSCHADKNEIAKIKDTELLHRKHVYESKVDCIACHDFIEHK